MSSIKAVQMMSQPYSEYRNESPPSEYSQFVALESKLKTQLKTKFKATFTVTYNIPVKDIIATVVSTFFIHILIDVLEYNLNTFIKVPIHQNVFI